MADSASALGSKIEGLDQQFGIEGFISMRPGQEGSPSVLLQHPNGRCVAEAWQNFTEGRGVGNGVHLTIIYKNPAR